MKNTLHLLLKLTSLVAVAAVMSLGAAAETIEATDVVAGSGSDCAATATADRAATASAPLEIAPNTLLTPAEPDASTAEETWNTDPQRQDKGFGAFCECTGNYTTATYYGAASTCIAAWQQVTSAVKAEALAYCRSIGHDYACVVFPGNHEQCGWNGGQYTNFGHGEYGCGSFC